MEGGLTIIIDSTSYYLFESNTAKSGLYTIPLYYLLPRPLFTPIL